MAATLQLHDLGVVEEAVKPDAGGDVVAEHGAEVFDGSVAGQDGGAGFVTAAEDLEQVFGRSRRQSAQAEVLEDEQVDAAQARDHLLTSAGGGGLGKILGEVESGAGEHGVAGLDGADADADTDVRLTRPGRTKDQRAVALTDEAQGGEVEDELLGHPGIEAPVEIIERLGLGQPSLLHATLKKQVTSTAELVFDQELEELDIGEVVVDGLLVAHRQRLHETGETDLTQLALELGAHDITPAARAA